MFVTFMISYQYSIEICLSLSSFCIDIDQKPKIVLSSVLNAIVEGDRCSRNFANIFYIKTRIMGLLGLMIGVCLAVSTQYISVTDRQTDWLTDWQNCCRIYIYRVCISASRGKYIEAGNKCRLYKSSVVTILSKKTSKF